MPRAERCPLLVGESNPYSADPEHALLPWPAGAAGDRLRRHLGLTDRQYLRRFRRANLLGAGRWSLPRARAAAAALLEAEGDGAVLVLLGARVAAAFLADSLGLLSRVAVGGSGRRAELFLLPHPSGRCRMWNEPGAAAEARRLVALACSLAGERAGAGR